MNSFIKYWNKRNRPKPQLPYAARLTYRHPYTGSKRFDRSCRNHGSCGWCESSRKHAKARQMPIAEWDLMGFEDMEEWEDSDRGRYQYLDEEGYCEWGDDDDWGDWFSYDDYDELDYSDLDDDPWDIWDPYGIEYWHRNQLHDPWEDYHNYTSCIDWGDPNSWRWEFDGLEEDHIMEIINNRLDTSEAI